MTVGETALSGQGLLAQVYRQDPESVGGLALSALASVVPLAVVLVLLGVLRVRAQWAALAGLAAALLVAIVGYGMPAGMSLSAAAHGAVFGLFPILWIVVNALWVFNMTVATGHFDVLRRSFGALSIDTRTQAILVAFCFGGLLEALAGFGAPVAITSVMLVALGFAPIKAAVVALVANTAPVAFGAMGVPVITLAQVTGLPLEQVSSVVGRQTPLLALFVPLVLVFIVDGRRGLREAWLPAVVCGFVFAVGQFVTSNFVSVELTDIVASLLGALSVFALARLQPRATWAARQPAGSGSRGGPGAASESEMRGGGMRDEGTADTPAEIRKAYAPYAIIVTVFGLAQLPGLKQLLASVTITIDWPFLDVLNPAGERDRVNDFSFAVLSTAGTLMVLAGVIVAVLLGVGARRTLTTWLTTVGELKWAILTVASVLALAYVMNASGQTTSIGLFVAGAGAALAFLSPVLGWFAVAVTGSDTSANALFGSLQVTAAQGAGLPPELLAGANSSGGVLGKMLSPQNLTIAAASVKLEGQEGMLLRKVIGWSLGMLLVLSTLIALQATPVLGWMLP